MIKRQLTDIELTEIDIINAVKAASMVEFNPGPSTSRAVPLNYKLLMGEQQANESGSSTIIDDPVNVRQGRGEKNYIHVN